MCMFVNGQVFILCTHNSNTSQTCIYLHDHYKEKTKKRMYKEIREREREGREGERVTGKTVTERDRQTDRQSVREKEKEV